MPAARSRPLPRVACWNVNDWGLGHQLQLHDAGIPVEWTIGCPILVQGADNERKWDRFLLENAAHLDRIPVEAPLTLRFHNWLSDFTSTPAEDRGEFEASPLVWRLREDGSLDSTPVVCPFGPIAAWSDLGRRLGQSFFLARLAERLPQAARLCLKENNEPTKGEIGAYTEPLAMTPNQPPPKDAFGNRLRRWRDGLDRINLRVSAYANEFPDPNAFSVALDRAYRERYEALTAALLENLPAAWRGRAFTAGYADLPIDRFDFDYRNPQVDWEFSPGGASLYFHGEKSDRIYADKSGSPNTDHRRLRSPLSVAMNAEPFNELLAELRPNQHNEVSVWLSPHYGRTVGGREMGRYLSPRDALGFYRGLVWACRAEVYCYFAASQVKLDDAFYGQPNDPPEARAWTEREFYDQLVWAVAEVYENPSLARFFREGQPIYTAEQSFYRWFLPSGPLRNRLLATDANPPRFESDGQGGSIDTWSKSDGQLDLPVFCLGWRLGEDPDGPTLLFLYSPTGARTDITVIVPGLGETRVPHVDEEGRFHFCGAPLSSTQPPSEPPTVPPSEPPVVTPPPLGSRESVIAKLREARMLLTAAEMEL